MSITVQRPDGAYAQRESRDDLLPDDMIVLDGPDAFAEAERAHLEVRKEIADAGGLDAWRARARPTRG